MMKKLLCVIMIFIMVMQCASFVYAQDWTDSLDVNIDMEVRQSGSSAFINGPLQLTGSSANADFRATLDMDGVLGNFINWYNKSVGIIDNGITLGLYDASERTGLINELNGLQITGEFIVKIIYPKSLIIPADFTNNSQTMYGFNSGALNAFYEKSRLVQPYNSTNNVITITIGVKNGLTVGELHANRDTYLDDLTLTAENVTLPTPGKYTVRGTMSGHILSDGVVGSRDVSLRVNYTGKQALGQANPEDTQNISATAILTMPAGGGGGSIFNGIVFNIDGQTNWADPISRLGLVKFEELPYPERPGYKLDAWYYDSALTKKVNEDIDVKGKVTLYGHWISDTLDTEDHFAYIIGYPDGTVRPENNITREEVATIFYRLLRENKQITVATTENDFTDVNSDRWSNKAISSLANGGYIEGYEDGTFAPEKNITRAEFATMATRFAKITDTESAIFTDIDNHWAREYILKAAGEGWVKGYTDGTFGPEKYITRAEVMAIINRMLARQVDADGLHADAKIWSDMDVNDWYYYIVEEATNAHSYTRNEDGITETWNEIKPNKIWIELDEMENPEN